MSEKELTRAVRKEEEIPAEPLKSFMVDGGLIKDKRCSLKIDQFYNGYSNLTYLLTAEDQQFVLRRPPFSAPKRGHDMGREFKVLQNLHQVFNKAPKAYLYSDNSEILGAPFYIMEKIEGIILTAKEAKERLIKPVQFAIIADTWLNTFVELHQVDYKAAGLEELGRPKGYVERQVINWGKQYLVAATEEVASAKRVMQWMESHQPKKYSFSLIHNDYKYDNLVFTDSSWTNTAAILDWEMCTLGDPLMDLGTSLGYWTTANDPEFMQNGLPSPTIMKGNPSRSQLVEQYALKSGRNIEHLTFYFAYGLFKIAVIAQQIYYRYKHGYTSDKRFASLNKVSALCCDTAWQAIQTNNIDKLFR